MATTQLWIISLVLCSALPSAATVNWKLTVTNNIQAYQHDCVIINCTFEYNNCTEEQKKIQSTPEKGIWMKEMESVKVYHPNSSQIDSAFRGRTELLGNISQKNCTLKINNLRKTDTGQYIFMVEGKTKNTDRCHYRYIKHPVTLHVDYNDTRPVITMDEVKVGSLAIVTCSINYTCVSNPPDLNWSHKQRGNCSTGQNRHGDQWILTSNLTFQTQDSDLDTMINCTAKYKNLSSSGYEENKESTLLKLGYPPRIKEESACSKNQCVCVVDSRPPSVIKWLSSDGKSVISTISAKEYKVEYELNILDVNVGVLYCEAINRHGKSTVSFSLGSSLGFLYIVISGFAVLIIILLAAIFYVWRFRIQKEKQRQDPIGQDAPRTPAPAVPEMCTDKEDMEDDDYIIPVSSLESPAQVKVPAKSADEDYVIPLEARNTFSLHTSISS
ncbi:sialic acid-binding Ig-like lectin 13 [Astyanax mexicanus]|uniref:sialic acid-binding Ig-like lectin 13 n=1 Tax=Astyanax mexicanus TaxID=7994 RepID=UPI0020CAEDC9|nr:sialic acid-binding Ig-like lectin 13 [Astyanax mexicanus]